MSPFPGLFSPYSDMATKTAATQLPCLSCPPPGLLSLRRGPIRLPGGAGLLTQHPALLELLCSTRFTEATTSVLVLGAAGSCTAVIFQATEPGLAL